MPTIRLVFRRPLFTEYDVVYRHLCSTRHVFTPKRHLRYPTFIAVWAWLVCLYLLTIPLLAQQSDPNTVPIPNGQTVVPIPNDQTAVPVPNESPTDVQEIPVEDRSNSDRYVRCSNGPLAIVAGTRRRSTVEGDYLVIEYDARTLQTRWYDYRDRFRNPAVISRNGSFLPVVYTKEKIAVHVCNLRFGDLLTVTTSPLGAPEGGADIRGATVAAIPALANTLDALQSGATTGGTTPVSSLGFGATTALGGVTVSGVNPGTMTYDESKPAATYSNANVTVSGEQVAIMLFALQNNATALIRGIDGNIAGWVERSTQLRPTIQIREPASVGYLREESASLLGRIGMDALDENNAARFDKDVTAVQSFSAELGSLAAALSNQGFGARAITIQNNYATLRGILDFINLGLNCTRSDIPDPSKPAKTNPKKTPPPPVSDDAAPCGKFEQSKFKAFHAAYENQIYFLTKQKAEDYEAQVAQTQKEMFGALHDLGEALKEIDGRTSEIFNIMNRWNTDSSVEQTDLIAPLIGNTLMRISIVVQRGYTPFVLANTPSGAPAAATAVASTASAPPAASTSTPAHAVKTILVEVHRLANFNLAGGVMLIHVPSSSFAVSVSPTPAQADSNSATGFSGTCNGIKVSVPAPPPPANGGPSVPPTYSCVSATQKSPWQVAGMVGMTWYPWGRDYFPRHRGFSPYPRNLLPSFLVATSVTSLGNAMGAINWEPIGGIDLFGGIGSAHRTVLPNGVSTTTALPSGYTLQTGTQLHVGFATGIAFDLGVFTQLFQKSSPAGLP